MIRENEFFMSVNRDPLFLGSRTVPETPYVRSYTIGSRKSEIGIGSRKFLVGNYSSSTVIVIVKPIPLSQRLRVCMPRGMS